MLLREAIEILARHAAKDCIGSGCGISSIPSQKEIELVICALHRVWPRIHGHGMTKNEAFNIGFPGIGKDEE